MTYSKQTAYKIEETKQMLELAKMKSFSEFDNKDMNALRKTRRFISTLETKLAKLEKLGK